MTSIINAFTFAMIVFTGVFQVSAQDNPPSTPLRTVPRVELSRYVGKWYEIAKYPNRFQKQCAGNTAATYTLKENGRIKVKNECLTYSGELESAVGEAKIVDKTSNSKLKVRFAPKFISFLSFVWGDYWIIDLDADYRYVMIGDPGRDYFWILSREPEMSDVIYEQLLRKAESRGFESARVQKTRQDLVAD